ncbi:GntR family transcriptional regulator, partial [Candidatus Binatus sp.]|uniref:GntR family transcriptional regulator n=2 Tax=Candidatus Binatus sp. TaxID=2811406 RepID=UPI003C6FE477
MRLTRVRGVGAIALVWLTLTACPTCSAISSVSSMYLACLLQYVTMNVSVQYQIRGHSGNQIAASIENAIRSGRLHAGERLPTVRALAARLRVSPTTVAAAYNA